MLSPQAIVDLIEGDCPATYNILCELSPSLDPVDLLATLDEYNDDHWDTHYWSGRYAQMKLDDQSELYLCTRYHDTCNSSGAVAIILTKQEAIEWYNDKVVFLPEWDSEYEKYTTITVNFFSYDNNDGSTLTVQISPIEKNTTHNLI